jgi:pimeloyl-ACP methyl ester carboxylesterase
LSRAGPFAKSLVAATLPLAGAAAHPADTLAPFQEIDCPEGVAPDALQRRVVCGQLLVPERQDRPDGRTLRLPVAIIRSASAAPAADPVVFIAGGPGASTLWSPAAIARFAGHPFVFERDLILYNQRGVPQTEPSLACRCGC